MPTQADRDPREDEEIIPSDDDVSSVRNEGSDEEGEDLHDNMEAWVFTHLQGPIYRATGHLL